MAPHMAFGDEFENGLITYGIIIGKPPFFRAEGEGTNITQKKFENMLAIWN